MSEKKSLFAALFGKGASSCCGEAPESPCCGEDAAQQKNRKKSGCCAMQITEDKDQPEDGGDEIP